MKLFIKHSIKYIIIALLFLTITLFILWSDIFDADNPVEPEYITYNSLKEYTEKKSNSEYTYDIIAQSDDYAVCFIDSNSSIELKILSRFNEKWVELNKNIDYKVKYYNTNRSTNDFNEIRFYDLVNSETNIIIVIQVMTSNKSGEKVLYTDNNKLSSLTDSQNTTFSYSVNQSKTIEMLFVYYIGFVDNFDKNNYTLYVNDNEYPYKEWGKLFRRF